MQKEYENLLLQDAVQKANEVFSKIQDFKDALRKDSYNITDCIHANGGENGIRFSHVIKKLEFICKTVSGFSSLEKTFLVPTSNIQQLTDFLSLINDRISDFSDIRRSFSNINNSCDDILSSHLFYILSILKPKSVILDFSAACTSLNQTCERAEAALGIALLSKGTAEKALRETQELLEKVKAGETMLETIENNIQAAKKLRDSVDDYQLQFYSFQKKLDEREGLYKEALQQAKGLIDETDTNLQQLKKGLSESKNQRTLIDENINRSEDMLTGATVAGLANAFGQAHEALEKKVNKAYWAFIVSIFLLVFAVILVGTNVSQYTTKWAYPSNNQSTTFIPDVPGQHSFTSLFYALSIKLTYLLPFLLLTGFTNRRYTQHFRLKEQYAYKYAMAMSIDGFMKQAPDYAGDIPALVFEELASDPSIFLSPYAKQTQKKSRMMPRFFDKLRAERTDNDEKNNKKNDE